MGSMKTTETYDVLIIGGGISGLAAALTLARQQHTALVLDSEVYRNAPSPHMHNVLAFDRVDPKEFREAARKNILDYYTTIEFQRADVVKIVEDMGAAKQQFTVTGRDGNAWTGRKVILANGVQDVFPDIEGYKECFAKAM
jgi:thioredoxin reductase